jgi:hypothetical protein
MTVSRREPEALAKGSPLLGTDPIEVTQCGPRRVRRAERGLHSIIIATELRAAK